MVSDVGDSKGLAEGEDGLETFGVLGMVGSFLVNLPEVEGQIVWA